jgi:hypothetical protein
LFDADRALGNHLPTGIADAGVVACLATPNHKSRMNRIRLLAFRAGVQHVAGLAVLAILISPFGGDSTDAEGGTVRAAEQDFPDPAADRSGTDEGIRVHGDWVIEVRNKDGSLAERREFENGLTGTGQMFLANTLARMASPGVWAIELHDDEAGPPSPCEGGVVVGVIPNCVIREPISSFLNTLEGVHSTTLAVSSTGFEVVLEGNFDANGPGTINQVSTYNCWSQPASTDPTTCNNIQSITGTNLQAPVDVLEGQQVLVTVRISFS